MTGISNHSQLANMWQRFVTCICWTTTAAPLSNPAILMDALFDPEHWACLIERYCHQNCSLLFLSCTSTIQKAEVRSSPMKAVWFSHFQKRYLGFRLTAQLKYSILCQQKGWFCTLTSSAQVKWLPHPYHESVQVLFVMGYTSAV